MKSQKPRQWIPIVSSDSKHHGEYEVSHGELTVRLGGRQKSTRASSTGVPAAFGAAADERLARLILSELAAEV
jgi:hypothetical protein